MGLLPASPYGYVQATCSRATLPRVGDEKWPRNPIDYFVLARLEEEGLHPSPEAARATRGEDGRELPQLAAFLADPPAGYRPQGMGERVAFAGRLDHDELADLLPAAEAMAVTSTFPEAFGMVAAEAAACGALPVVANHSGLGEVARTLAAAVPAPARGWLSFELGPGAVRELADDLAGWLGAPSDVRKATRAAMVEATRARYSWDGVARTVVAAAQGDLAGLPEPQ